MEIPAELQLAAISASAALLIGGSVAVFGHGPVLSVIARAGGFAMRRRRLTTLALGLVASVGLAVANAVGMEPAPSQDAFSWFQSQVGSWLT